jgi:hypothetical protein
VLSAHRVRRTAGAASATFLRSVFQTEANQVERLCDRDHHDRRQLAFLGLLTLTWLLTTQSRVRSLPPDSEFAQALAHYRENLERRTFPSSRYLRWYVLPTLPGILLLVLARATHDANALLYLMRFAVAAIAVMVFLTQLQNSVGAKYQRRAAQLDLVTELT